MDKAQATSITFSDKEREMLKNMIRDKHYNKGLSMVSSINHREIDDLLECIMIKSRITVKYMIIDKIALQGYYSRKEIADILGVFVNYIDKLYKKNKLEAIKIGKTLYFRNKNYTRNEYPRHITRPKEDFRGIRSDGNNPSCDER